MFPRPISDRTVQYQDVSKRQLARAVNDQTATIQQLRDQVKAMAKILIAIAAEPEAFSFDDGRVSIRKSAMDKVQRGTQLRIEYTDTVAIINAVVEKDVPRVTAPGIVGVM
jgi:hypothetical protein